MVRRLLFTQFAVRNTIRKCYGSSSQLTAAQQAKYEDISARLASIRLHKKLPDRIVESLSPALRVDHSGEFGADRIYNGQYDVLHNGNVGGLIKHMWEQEIHHLKSFNKTLPEFKVRPSALQPIWHAAGYMLGYLTAKLGKEGAMACTVAVEEVIGEHYDEQLRVLLDDIECLREEALLTGDNADDIDAMQDSLNMLMSMIAQFRDEELEHHDIGLANDAELAPFYSLLSAGIKLGCQAAISVAKRV